MALVAAMRPKSCGSSTIGMKKSVVAMMQVLSSSCQTAASSAVSVPTSSCLNGAAAGWSARSCCSTEGASLQPQPPPCARLVSLGAAVRSGASRSIISLIIGLRGKAGRTRRVSGRGVSGGDLGRLDRVFEGVGIKAIEQGARYLRLRIHQEADLVLRARQFEVMRHVVAEPVALPGAEQDAARRHHLRIVDSVVAGRLLEHDLADIGRIGRDP